MCLCRCPSPWLEIGNATRKSRGFFVLLPQKPAPRSADTLTSRISRIHLCFVFDSHSLACARCLFVSCGYVFFFPGAQREGTTFSGAPNKTDNCARQPANPPTNQTKPDQTERQSSNQRESSKSRPTTTGGHTERIHHPFEVRANRQHNNQHRPTVYPFPVQSINTQR